MAVKPFPNDPVNENISETAGSDLIFRQATGFEKALADVDAQRLTAIYAELVKEQWDADKISLQNLPYLAWAKGVNLWEDDWSEEFKRWWTKNQWELKSQRGSLLGLQRFVRAVQGEVKRVIRPPAITYPLRSDTDEERAAYVARFPQLRLYPFVAREKLPWLCYTSNFLARGAYGSVTFLNNPRIGSTNTSVTFGDNIFTFGVQVAIGSTLSDTLDNLMVLLTDTAVDFVRNGNTIHVCHKTQGFAGNSYKLACNVIGATTSGSTLKGGKNQSGTGTPGRNGSFIGPLRRLYPTVQNQGGKYTRTSTIWDRGVETTLTIRKIANVKTGEGCGWGFTPGVSAYDEQVALPLKTDVCFLSGKKSIFLNGGPKYGVFPNKAPKLRTITIPRSGPLEVIQGKAQYRTIKPQAQLLQIEPELVKTRHAIRPTELYASRGQYLYKKFLPPSNAWRYVYERWYIFDADRVPDYRRRGVYLNHTRLGIPKYTAEALIKIRTKLPRYKTNCSGYVYGFLCGPDDKAIQKVRRAVTASMALRDTVLIDTKTVRTLQVGDLIDASGRFTVGQLVPA